MAKRVCFITDTLCDANGVSRFIQDIASIAYERQTPFLAITSTKKSYCQKSKNIVILQPFLSIKMPFYPALDLVIPPIFKLHKTIKSFNPDVIHISTPGIVGLFGLISARILKKEIIGTYHTDFPAFLYENTKSNFVKNMTTFIVKIFYKKFKFLFIRSEVYRDIVKNELNFEQNRIFTIPAGIDIQRFNHVELNREIWSRYGVKKESKKALFVGRVTREKNIPFLLDVWKENYKSDKNSHLVLVGVGEFFDKKEEYRDFNILFLGHKEGIELEELYKNSDFFVFPSNSDTLGQVVIEAMACGICSIIGDEGGATTIIEDKVTGIILEKNNKTKWLEAIQLLMSDNDRRNYYNQNALLSSKNFDIQKSFDYFFKKIEE